MRVILLNQYYPPSAAPTGSLLADLAAGLRRRGVDVEVICSDRDYADPARRFPGRETVDGVRVRRVRTSGFGRGGPVGRVVDYLTFLLGAIRRLAFVARPDWVVVLTTPPLVAVPALALAGLRGARVAYWVMDVYPELAFELGVMRRGSPAGRLFGALSRWALRRSDRVIALGETMARRLKNEVDRDYVVIHNWIDGADIRPEPLRDHRVRETRGWTDRFVVLYSGNLGLAHDFATVLDAAELLREDSGILFAFAGAGPRLEALREEARGRGLAHFEFHPWVAQDELGASLTSADVHLVTLREGVEGLLVPSKIYGILAAGRPTLFVGPAEGEITRILEDGRCGTRIPVGDAAGLASAIRGYRADPLRAAAEGARARETFESRFALGISVDRFVRLLIGERGEA